MISRRPSESGSRYFGSCREGRGERDSLSLSVIVARFCRLPDARRVLICRIMEAAAVAISAGTGGLILQICGYVTGSSCKFCNILRRHHSLPYCPIELSVQSICYKYILLIRQKANFWQEIFEFLFRSTLFCWVNWCIPGEYGVLSLHRSVVLIAENSEILPRETSWG